MNVLAGAGWTGTASATTPPIFAARQLINGKRTRATARGRKQTTPSDPPPASLALRASTVGRRSPEWVAAATVWQASRNRKNQAKKRSKSSFANPRRFARFFGSAWRLGGSAGWLLAIAEVNCRHALTTFLTQLASRCHDGPCKHLAR